MIRTWGIKVKTLPCPPRGQGSILLVHNSGAPRSESGAPNHDPGSTSAHHTQSWQHQIFLPCPPRGQGSILRIKARSWQHQRASQLDPGSTKHAPWHILAAPIFPALPLFAHQDCTKPHQASTNMHQILPCPPQGQGSLLEAIILGRKIQLKIQFNSFLHQIKSPSKSQNPRIESV